MLFASSGRPLRRICLAILVSSHVLGTLVSAGTPPVKNAVIEQAAHPMYLGTITGGVKTSDVYTEGNFSMVVPVWSTLGMDATLSGDVIYIEPYTSWGERGEVAASLGFGWRHLFGSQPVSALQRHEAPQAGFFDEGIFVGANVFIDMLDTEADNQFWQLGVGVEVGTRYLEVRGNYYIPLTDRQLAEETRVRQSFTSSQASTSVNQQVVPTGPVSAIGNSIGQDANVTTTSVTTVRSTTTTIEQLFRRYEEGMEGWDAELALLIPGLDQYFDFRVIGGYYSFDNQPFGPQEGGTGNVEGWKAGVEIRPVPAVILTGTWYEDERLTGSDWTVGVQLQVPFEMGDLGDGKGFWDRIGDSFKPRRRHLMERLAEPVHRQNAAIKLASEVEQETEKVSEKTSVQRVTRVTHSTKRIVIADDVVFVNNGGDVGNGIAESGPEETGAAAQPFNTIQEGADQAALNNVATQRIWTVYTQGAGAHGGTAYNESVTLGASTRLISSATPLEGPVGDLFGTGDRPLVVGGIVGKNAFIPGATSPSFVEVHSYDITGGYQSLASVSEVVSAFVDAQGTAIYFDGVDEVVLINNKIENSKYGALVEHGTGLMEVTIIGNQVLNIEQHHGLQIVSSGDLRARIVDNVLNGNDACGLFLYGATFEGEVVGNTASGNGAVGLDMHSQNFTGLVSGNTANNNQNFGIYIDGYNQLNADITANTVDGPGYVGGIYLNSLNMTGDITGNTVTDSGGFGDYGAISFTGGSYTGNITGNTVRGNDSDGISITGTSFAGNISGNTIKENTGTGLLVSVGTGTITGTISDNVIKRNGAEGIKLETTGGFTGTMAGNEIICNDGDGINVFGKVSEGSFDNNQMNDNGGVGFRFDDGIGGSTAGVRAFEGSFTANTINNNGGDGVRIFASENSINAGFYDNVVNENAESGIWISNSVFTMIPASISSTMVGNETSFNGDAGVMLSASTVVLTMDDHKALLNGEAGVYLVGQGRRDITNSNASENGTSGFYLAGNFSSSSNLSGNTANLNGENGFHVNWGIMAGSITGNSAAENTGSGFVLEFEILKGSFTGNISNDNTLDGFNTNVEELQDGPFNGNTATGNGGINFNNLNQPLANP